MATRSSIGILTEKGTIVSVYCHWDGYPSGVGETLYECYTDPELVHTMMTLGDISSLADTLDKTVFYSRDRGEDEVDFQEFETREQWVDFYSESGVEYMYLWTESGWLVSDYGGKFDSLELVLEEILD